MDLILKVYKVGCFFCEEMRVIELIVFCWLSGSGAAFKKAFYEKNNGDDVMYGDISEFF